MSANPAATDSRDVAERDELRRHLARVLEEHATTILNDALALFGFTGMDVADRETTARIGEMILYVLIAATRDPRPSTRSRMTRPSWDGPPGFGSPSGMCTPPPEPDSSWHSPATS